MSDRKILDIADQYLMQGDIAQMRNERVLWNPVEEQLKRLSPEMRDATLDAPLFDAIQYLRTGRGLPQGVSSFYEPNVDAGDPLDSLTYGDFVGSDGFDNRPALPYIAQSVGPDTGGPHGPKVRQSVRRLDLLEPTKTRQVSADTILELYAGEALELSRRAEAGTASPDELRLLEAYQNFFATRTGM